MQLQIIILTKDNVIFYHLLYVPLLLYNIICLFLQKYIPAASQNKSILIVIDEVLLNEILKYKIILIVSYSKYEKYAKIFLLICILKML